MWTANLILAFSLISRSYAHFAIGHLLVNGTDTGLWKHVLEVGIAGDASDNNGYPPGNHFPKTYPQSRSKDFLSENITCGRIPFAAMDRTAIADVIAGDEIGFRTMSDREINWTADPVEAYGRMYHPGAGQIWLSRAPHDDLKAYRGDGDWFKVAYAGPKNNTHWSLHHATDFNFTLPRSTPPGRYLMRFEYIYPSPYEDAAQFFISCALINVIGPGGGLPTEFYRFPGSYDAKHPALQIPYDQEYSYYPEERMRMLNYVPFGGTVWTG